MLLSLIAIAVIGILLGILGGGGSVLILPLLVYLVGIEPVLATSYSLAIVGTAALVGASGYLRQGLVDSKAVFAFGIPSIVGVFLSRSLLMPAIPDVLFASAAFELTKNTLVMLVFAILILASGLSMIFKARRNSESSDPQGPDRNVLVSILAGVLLGVLTGFVGAGGGFMIVPALVFLLRIPIRHAIGTSLFVIAMKSLLGFFADALVLHGIQWSVLLQFIVVAVIGILVGVRLNRLVPAAKLKSGFGWMVLGVGIAVLIRELSYN